MRVYRLYHYPEDMCKILEYLRAHGNLYVSGTMVEMLYAEFSGVEYCATWMIPSDDGILNHFASWLDKYDYTEALK